VTTAATAPDRGKAADLIDQQVALVRHFNRFYTRQIGVLSRGFLESPFSLTEVRVLYELAHRERPRPTELARELGLDAGYLSRILRGFHRRGLIAKEPSQADGRQTLLRLTRKGRETCRAVEARQHEAVVAMLRHLTADERRHLVGAMQRIERLLAARSEPKVPYMLRPHHPGDMGWVVHRHGVLYAQEYGWDERFEALVARIVADFIDHFDPKRERCWIAEREGEVVGSVFCVKKSKTVAKLRLLLVEPKARGLGIGTRLVAECVRFARQAGYKKLMLWTNSVLHAARHIYEEAGFRLVAEEPHHSFGHDLIGQTWELEL
jgi:DNA-binding MarR family transcriptional regulator/N-acetylglutamate synthase-like GNAT family acetyltransferase